MGVVTSIESLELFTSTYQAYLPLAPDDDAALASTFEGEGSLASSPLGLLPSEIIVEISLRLDLKSTCTFS